MVNCKYIREANIICLIQHCEADLCKVSLKILNSGIPKDYGQLLFYRTVRVGTLKPLYRVMHSDLLV